MVVVVVEVMVECWWRRMNVFGSGRVVMVMATTVGVIVVVVAEGWWRSGD